MLKKDDIGKGKESCFDLPNLGFSYGHFPRSDPENVGQCFLTIFKYVRNGCPTKKQEKDIL